MDENEREAIILMLEEGIEASEELTLSLRNMLDSIVDGEYPELDLEE
jgi:hypothetical protein